MDFPRLLIFAIVQSLAEYLFMSGFGHLILAPHLFGFSDMAIPTRS